MIPRFKPILFLESHPRIRSLFDSFWGLSMIENEMVHFASGKDFLDRSPDECALFLVDRRSIEGEIVEWMSQLELKKPQIVDRIIWVVETKEERDRIIALGIPNVLRLPFQWSQWLPVICKMGLRWRLWRQS